MKLRSELLLPVLLIKELTRKRRSLGDDKTAGTEKMRKSKRNALLIVKPFLCFWKTTIRDYSQKELEGKLPK